MLKGNHTKIILSTVFITFFITIVLFNYDWSFNTKFPKGDIFTLTLNSDIDRVMPSEEIYLAWNKITVDGTFENYLIERKKANDDDWDLITKIPDRFTSSYTDTIFDDEDLIYRVGINTEEGNIIWAQKSIEIPNTDSILVPIEFDKIMDVIKSPLLDDNEIVLVDPGEYIENLFILGKDIILKSTGGRENTTIFARDYNVVVSMNNSTIDGFTITNGVNERDAGGVLIRGKGVVKNCYIKNNTTTGGSGGGINIFGDGSVYNSIFSDNNSKRGGGNIHIRDGHGEIINNTIMNGNIVVQGNCEGLLLRNNIFYNAGSNLSFTDQNDQDSVIVDYSRFDIDLPFASNSITSDPLFSNFDNFEISNSSPCLNKGHPDEQYNDIDGSRNDMGAYGGPIR